MSRRSSKDEATIWPIDPHTTLKHLLYRAYIDCWMAKILTTFPKAYIVDCFAGPGVYEKGQPGSSIIASNAYIHHRRRAKFGQLEIICCEERADRTDRLSQELAKLPSVPTLRHKVLPHASFNDAFEGILRETRLGSAPPVLWLIDPFDIKSVSMSHVNQCLEAPRNESILTFFVDEMYRFAGRNANLSPALDRHFGGESWREALGISGENAKKKALTTAYCRALESSVPRSFASSFGVRAKNSSSRYELVYATHSDKGLECWTNATWRFDKIAGSKTSAELAEQDDLFRTVDTERLERALLENSGSEITWDGLISHALQNGYKETHLRQALSNMNERGEVFRVWPIEASTPWPTGCRVQFFSPEDYDEPDGEISPKSFFGN